ncbi:MAG TPA: hypothetical protein VGR14_06785 [Verrucomicrobiae bacterium]|jgi:hypothetical protein|nr:hypothetical protein [Verrucomicrobiae bacterium]
MRIPESVRKCVVYVGTETTDPGTGTTAIVFRGTGFLVSVPTSIRGKNFHYIVTAKHVAVMLDREDAFIISVNSKSGALRGIRAETKQVKWHCHDSDFSADVALTPLGADLRDFDIVAMPVGMFVKKSQVESIGVGPGDELVISGLFSRHPGKTKNMPIIRIGHIAMMPDDPVPTQSFGDMEAYLIEARSIGGLSGSPVLLLKHVYTHEVVVQLYLLGLVHGHWDTPSDAMTDAMGAKSGILAGVNMGIAIVTPAQKILDIIESKPLLEERDQIVRDHEAKNIPTKDNQ